MSLESEYRIVIRWALRAGDVKRAREAVAWAQRKHGLDMSYVLDEPEFRNRDLRSSTD